MFKSLRLPLTDLNATLTKFCGTLFTSSLIPPFQTLHNTDQQPTRKQNISGNNSYTFTLNYSNTIIKTTLILKLEIHSYEKSEDPTKRSRQNGVLLICLSELLWLDSGMQSLAGNLLVLVVVN